LASAATLPADALPANAKFAAEAQQIITAKKADPASRL
jgi:hypothetical protein